MASGYTLEYAIEMRDLYMECARALASGQAKRYKIGTREYEGYAPAEVYKQIRYWSDWVDALSGKARTNRAVRFVPRDL
jgi:hypothetical protein